MYALNQKTNNKHIAFGVKVHPVQSIQAAVHTTAPAL